MALSAHNLARLAEESYERRGDYEALYFEGKWHSSGELADRARRLAQGLSQLGIRPGDRVVVMTSNCPEVGITYNALWRAGAVITPAIFLLQEDDLRHILTSAEATAVVTSPEFLPIVQAASRSADSVRWLVSTGDDAEGVISLASLEVPEAGEVV
jgi:long-chain acyl-CoA synthetase